MCEELNISDEDRDKILDHDMGIPLTHMAAEALRANPAAEGASDLLRALYKNMNEKAELICEVFGHAFTTGDLLNNITPAEMNGLLNAIVKGN